MSRVDEVKELIDNIDRTRRHIINTEYSALLDVNKLLGNIALNLAELNDRLDKREDGLNVSTTIQT